MPVLIQDQGNKISGEDITYVRNVEPNADDTIFTWSTPDETPDDKLQRELQTDAETVYKRELQTVQTDVNFNENPDDKALDGNFKQRADNTSSNLTTGRSSRIHVMSDAGIIVIPLHIPQARPPTMNHPANILHTGRAKYRHQNVDSPSNLSSRLSLRCDAVQRTRAHLTS